MGEAVGTVQVKMFLNDAGQPEVDFLHSPAVNCRNFWANCLYESEDTHQYKFGRVKAY